MSKFANAKPSSNTAAADLPLFFKQPYALNSERHGKAGLLPVQEYSFAAESNSLVINAIEFFEALKHYPIVFTQSGNIMPAVVLGLEQKNAFITKNGKWLEGKYVPAYVRRYPFVFSSVPDSEQLVLCVDEAAKQYQAEASKTGMPLFSNGEPSELTKNALNFCSAYHAQYEVTRRFCDDIAAAGLLTPSQTDAKTPKGRAITLQGFQMIDEKKFNALPQETVMDFFRKGWLPLIYAAIISSNNWNALVDLAGE